MSDQNEKLQISGATPEQSAMVLEFIRELAAYENLEHLVSADEASINRSLSGHNPEAHAILAFWDGEPAGFAVYCYSFSTFLARRGLFLEDLFVRPAFRRHGIGRALLAHLARLAVHQNCSRMEWWVLEWNRPAMEFYESLGGQAMSEWTPYRLTGASLRSLARRAPAEVTKDPTSFPAG